MSTVAYTDYRDSGVEWLGNVPVGWATKPLKHLADFVNGMAFKPDEWADEGTPIIRIQNLNGGDEFNSFGGVVHERHHVRFGDLLFGWSGNRGTSFGPFLWGRYGVYYLNQHIFKVLPYNCNAAWFYWCLKAVTLYVEQQAHGIIGMVHVTKGALGAVAVPLPRPDEQAAIASFLDRETAKIDALVAEQERLIALLQEKRQAVISHAVTKGLDPKVPMKDSGVEWLGQVPESWLVTRLKFVALQDGNGIQIGPFGGMLKDLPEVPTGYKLYGQQNIISGDFDAGDRWISKDVFMSNPAYRVNPCDLLVTRKGTLGNCRIVPEGVAPGWFDSDSICIRIDKLKVRVPFLQILLHEAGYIERQIIETRRGAILSGINTDVLANFMVLLPPLDAQDVILSGLAHAIDECRRILDAVGDAVSLLKERRSALISAAVTGKIDVRGLVAPSETPAVAA